MSLCFGMLPAFASLVPVAREKWLRCYCSNFYNTFSQTCLCFHFSPVVFCKMEGIFECCKGKWKCMQSTLYLLSLNKTICSSSVCPGGVCVYKFITLPLWNLVTCTVITSNKISLSPLLPHGKDPCCDLTSIATFA